MNDVLADIYLKQGRIDDAKERLEFVAERGNKLYSAQKARELLKTL